jgi:molybdopterin synthase sulfur carrier subunit
MMTGTVLLFGKLKDVFGATRIACPEGVSTAAELRARLAELHPDLAAQIVTKSVRIAVNQKLVMDEAGTRLSAGDEIALLPPLSGG